MEEKNAIPQTKIIPQPKQIMQQSQWQQMMTLNPVRTSHEAIPELALPTPLSLLTTQSFTKVLTDLNKEETYDQLVNTCQGIPAITNVDSWYLESEVRLLLFDDSKLKKRGGLEGDFAFIYIRRRSSQTSGSNVSRCPSCARRGWACGLCYER
jgi:hypothetical protein